MYRQLGGFGERFHHLNQVWLDEVVDHLEDLETQTVRLNLRIR